ncbi:hypothetical protein Y032_0087g2026 [Ancylostoma ceylanicum]|nr:hypothetical protein Y032_0087g2026 [Ancylostoma ceylanicum]
MLTLLCMSTTQLCTMDMTSNKIRRLQLNTMSLLHVQNAFPTAFKYSQPWYFWKRNFAENVSSTHKLMN